MSKCLWCKGPVESSVRNGKPKKYCSKKCADKFYGERDKNNMREKLDPPTPCKACGKLVERFLDSNKPKKYCSKKCSSNPNWVERDKKNAWIKENCTHKEDVAKELGIHIATVTNRMRTLGLKEEYFVVKQGTVNTYVKNSDIEKIKRAHEDKGIPEGYITRQEVCDKYNLSVSRLSSRLEQIAVATNKDVVKGVMKNVYHPQSKATLSTVLYKKEEVLKVLNSYKEHSIVCVQCDKEFNTIYPGTKYCSKTCSRKSEKDRRHARMEAKYVPMIELYEIIDSQIPKQRPAPKHFLNNNIANYAFERVGNRWYLLRSQLDSFIEQFRNDYERMCAKKEKQKQEAAQRQSEKIVRRTSDQNSWEYKERLWMLRVREKIISTQEKHGIDSVEFQNLILCIQNRTSYLKNYWSTGNIATFKCNKCNSHIPFYEFHASTSKINGLNSTCKSCLSKQTQKKSPVNKSNKKCGKQKLRILVATSIKRHINQETGAYQNGNGVREVWRAIKEKCGYSLDDLVSHIESQFTSKMNWDNQTTPKNPGEYGWHLDHIKPHSEFHYTSVNHPDFIKCWDLNNLQPMSAVMNMQKANKNLYIKHRSSFMCGIKSNKEYKSGIWKHLPYTNLQAKKFLEKKFERGMNWGNHGDYWHIDHINPLAHLAYLSAEDENFKLVWTLDNLQPLVKFSNLSKSSVFEGQRWYHNYTDTESNLQSI